MEMENQVKVASMVSFLFAVWLFISPYVLGFAGQSVIAIWTVNIAGIGVAALSLIRFFIPHGTAAMSWINVLVGLGLIASPFVWYLTGTYWLMWDFIIVGAALVIFNLWAALGHLITV